MIFVHPDDEYLQRLEHQTLIGQDFIEAAFRDWLEDSDDYRCPFPEAMREELSEKTFRLFMEWTFQLDNSTPISSDVLSEKFGEIIQNVGLSLAQTDDERITIQYPGLPRVGDKVNFHDSVTEMRTGEIIQRYLIENTGKKEIRVRVRYSDTAEEWETSFELNE